ncbi:MAG: tetratricopeptide repeat protein [Bdellovibrionales bacterium]|nr:tetratricopeptide repeat protein [Bdellovibrionales bacterium]
MNTAAAEPTHFDDLWDFNNPKATEEKFRTLLVTVSKSENQEYLLQLKTQIARTQGLQRNFELAHKTLDEVESKLSERTPVAQIRYLLERGRVFNSSKERTQAKPLFEKSFQLAKKALEDNFAVDAAHMMAIVESNPQKQMEWNKIALAIAENSKEERARKWLGSLYNNMGWTYHDSGNYSEALDLFEKALEFRKSKATNCPKVF